MRAFRQLFNLGEFKLGLWTKFDQRIINAARIVGTNIMYLSKVLLLHKELVYTVLC